MNIYDRELSGFEHGIIACWRVWEQDVTLLNCAREEAQKKVGYVPPPEPPKSDKRLPLWRRVSGLITDESERAIRPMLRRDHIRKLLKTVDQILRAELKPPTGRDNDSAQQKESLAALKSERTVFWDPLPEVCFYLEIGQSKLAQYSRQSTGLGAKDLVDRIRVENLRASIRERLRKVVSAAQDFAKEDVKRLSPRDGAGVLLKALKASEHFVARQAMALSVGIASKARLYRACLACEGVPLEEIERQEAERVFAESREVPPESVGAPPELAAVQTPAIASNDPQRATGGANPDGTKRE